MAADEQLHDIAIVGGGLAGASLALALRDLPLSVVLVEAFAPDSNAQPSFDERTTALGNASRRIFEATGIWSRLATEAAAIDSIHVSDAGRFGFARLCAREFGQEALGYVVPNRVLGREMWSALEGAPRVRAFMPARVASLQVMPEAVRLQVEQAGVTHDLRARLVVAADGANSMVRAAAGIGAEVHDYDQVAIVAALCTDLPADGVAFERFTTAGPIALLPIRSPQGGNWRTLVWAARPEDADRLLSLDDAAFMQAWQQAFGWRAGRARQVGRRGRYPLSLSRSLASGAPRIVLLGNASQSLHPVAGQGFNLALRDVAQLAESLATTPVDQIGSPQWVAAFAAERTRDRDGVVRFTDALVRVFGNEHLLVAAARDAGLLLFDLLPPAKRALSRVSLGFGRRSTRLARGLPLVAPE